MTLPEAQNEASGVSDRAQNEASGGSDPEASRGSKWTHFEALGRRTSPLEMAPEQVIFHGA